MFNFLRLINRTTDDENNIRLLESKEDVKAGVIELVNKLSSIEKDFKLMDRHFETKFNILIAKKQNILIHLYLDYLEKRKSKKKIRFRKRKKHEKIQNKCYLNSPLFHALEAYLLPQTLSEIVFKDFLIFYDEYSYAINERIIKIYEMFEEVEKASKYHSYLLIHSPDYGIRKLNLENIKYRDFHYFLIKLEKKLSKFFGIGIHKLENILYGYHFKEVETQTRHIQRYYDYILIYKCYSYVNNIGINIYPNFYSFSKINFPSQNKAIKASICKHVVDFNIDFPHLYDYHKKIPKTFILSKTRFSFYKKIMKKYKKWKKVPPGFSEEDKELFKGYFRRDFDEIELSLRDVLFKYISYDYKKENEYFKKLNIIRHTLQRYLR